MEQKKICHLSSRCNIIESGCKLSHPRWHLDLPQLCVVMYNKNVCIRGDNCQYDHISKDFIYAYCLDDESKLEELAPKNQVKQFQNMIQQNPQQIAGKRKPSGNLGIQQQYPQYIPPQIQQLPFQQQLQNPAPKQQIRPDQVQAKIRYSADQLCYSGPGCTRQNCKLLHPFWLKDGDFCTNYMNSQCRFGEKCKYSHVLTFEELMILYSEDENHVEYKLSQLPDPQEILNKAKYESQQKALEMIQNLNLDEKQYLNKLAVQRVTQKEAPQCKICFENFQCSLQEQGHHPFILECGHSICYNCLAGILKKQRFECPFCRKVINGRTFADFKKNHGLIEILKQ